MPNDLKFSNTERKETEEVTLPFWHNNKTKKELLEYDESIVVKSHQVEFTGEIDVPRLLQGKKDFWLATQVSTVAQKKKLIITDWSLKYATSESNDFKYWAQLLDARFEIYLYYNETLFPVKSVYDLCFADISLMPLQDVIKTACQQGLAVDEILIIDYFKKNELFSNNNATLNSAIPCLKLKDLEPFKETDLGKIARSCQENKILTINAIEFKGNTKPLIEYFFSLLAVGKTETLQLKEFHENITNLPILPNVKKITIDCTELENLPFYFIDFIEKNSTILEIEILKKTYSRSQILELKDKKIKIKNTTIENNYNTNFSNAKIKNTSFENEMANKLEKISNKYPFNKEINTENIPNFENILKIGIEKKNYSQPKRDDILEYEINVDLNDLQQNLLEHPKVKSIILSNVKSINLKNFNKELTFPNIQSLSLDLSLEDFSSTVFNSILTNFPNLRHILIGGKCDIFPTNNKNYPTLYELQELKISINGLDSDIYEYLMKGNFPKLKYISVSNANSSLNNSMKSIAILPSFSKLRRIDFIDLNLTKQQIFELYELPDVHIELTNVCITAPEQENNMALDSNTGDPTTFVVEKIFLRKKNDYPRVSNYRLQINDKLTITTEEVTLQMASVEKENLKILNPTDIKYLTDLRSKYEQTTDDNIYFGQVTHLLEPSKWTLLPSLTAYDKLIAYESNTTLEFARCSKNNFYYIRLPESEKAFITQINFLIEAPNQQYKHSEEITLGDSNPIENGFFGEDGTLGFGFCNLDSEISDSTDEKKIAWLHDFFLNKFTEKPLSDITEKGINLLNFLLQEQAGVCRHRAILFKAFSDQLGIQCRVIINTCHAYVEVILNSKWIPLDLGGGQAEILETGPLTKPWTATNSNNPQQIINKNKPAPYATSFSSELTIKTADDYAQLLAKGRQLTAGKKNMLLIFNSTKEAQAFNLDFLKTLLKQNQSIFYIDDFKKISEESILVNSHSAYCAVQSEFVQFLNSHKKSPVLVMNVSRAEHIGQYMLVENNQRHYEKTFIPTDMLVIATMTRDQIVGLREDFFSRFSFRVQIDWQKIPEITEQSMPLEENRYVINLCHTIDWESNLIGCFAVPEGKLSFEAGALLQAINDTKSGIKIINPPKSHEFEIFWISLTTKRQFYANGEYHQLPDNFSLEQVTQNFAYLPHDWTSLEPDVPWQYVLNNSTYHSFFKNYSYQNEKLHTKSGWLNSLKSPNIISILVTESLSESKWQHLIQEARANKKQLQIELAPNATIPDNINSIIKKNPSDSSKFSLFSSNKIILYYSNDIDFTAAEYAALYNPINLTHISSQINFSKLVENIEVTTIPSQLPHFKHTIEKMWEQLINGQTVMLKGEISEDVVNHLVTLTAEEPHLWLNGIKYPVSGYLIIVTKPETKKFSFVTDPKKIVVTQEEYWQKLAQQFGETASAEVRIICNKLGGEYNFKQLATMTQQFVKQNSIRKAFKPFLFLEPHHAERLRHLKNITPPNLPSAKNSDNFVQRRLQKVVTGLNAAPYIFLVGPSGCGKSTTVLEELPPYYRKQGIAMHLHIGLKHLMEWANQMGNNDNMPILFIDEANLAPNGSYEIFEALFQDPRIINGKTLSIYHKVIFAGNYTQYSSRQEHDFFKRHGNITHYKALPDIVVAEQQLLSLIKTHCIEIAADKAKEIIATFLNIVESARTYDPKVLITPRNLQMIAFRFIEQWQLVKQRSTHENFSLFIQELAALSSYQEVNSLLSAPQHKKFFEQEKLLIAKEYFSLLSLVNLPSIGMLNNFYVTTSRQPIMAALKQQLRMRELKINSPELMSYGCNGVLLEGGSGIGKSELLINYLQSEKFVSGFTASTTVPGSRRFYQMTPSNLNKVKETLLKAFHEGAIVIIDEINTMPIEEFLNSLLMGIDSETGKRAENPGFMVLATQNPINFPGRKMLSIALQNRLVLMPLNDYTQQELTEIALAKGYNSDIVARVVKNFWQETGAAKARHELIIPTPRDLFNQLEEECRQVLAITL